MIQQEKITNKSSNGSALISVVIPVYNVEQYLAECIESVINQTYKNLEIILVDDGSPDNCGKICDEYALKDSRIKVIHKKNGGLSSARNAGIDIAKGEYITFIDSDDYISLNMIKCLYQAIESECADISVCRFTELGGNLNNAVGSKIIGYNASQTLKLILTEKRITTSACGKLYRSNLFRDISYPEGRIYEDLATTYKVVNKSEKIVLDNRILYYYRTNPKSITKSGFSNKQLDYYYVWQELYQFVKDNYPQYVRYAINHSVRISISFLRKISECNFEDKEVIKFLTKKVRRGILGYLFSKYAFTSKMYGMLISVSPKVAMKVFSNNASRVSD